MVGSLFKAFTLLGSEWVMWLLMLLSIISFAVIFERLRNLRNQEKLGFKLWKEKVEPLMTSSSTSDIGSIGKDWINTYPCLESGLVEVLGSKQNSNSKENLELLAQSYLSRRKIDLEKNLAFLGTVGSNAPFIGLFGTVLGIIKAFHDMGSKVESQGAQTISVGISEALVATAIGLLVAIPAVVFFNYFQRKIKTILGRAESLANFIISQSK
jgi:biopolymer transport protein ExbB/TolQ